MKYIINIVFYLNCLNWWLEKYFDKLKTLSNENNIIFNNYKEEKISNWNIGIINGMNFFLFNK